jgi:hypothetical protein
MNERRRIDPKRTRAVLGSGAAIAMLLAAGVLVANALAAKPKSHVATTTTTSTTVPATGKVTICHHTHSKKNPGVTITVNVHAWKAHQRHGDTVGACPAATTTTTTTTTASTTTTTTTAAAPTTHGKSGEAHGKSGEHGSPHDH